MKKTEDFNLRREIRQRMKVLREEKSGELRLEEPRDFDNHFGRRHTSINVPRNPQNQRHLKGNFSNFSMSYDDVIKWNFFRITEPLWGEFAGHKGQWHGALMFTLIGAWTNGRVNNRAVGDLRSHGVHYDVILMAVAADGLLPLGVRTPAVTTKVGFRMYKRWFVKHIALSAVTYIPFSKVPATHLGIGYR